MASWIASYHSGSRARLVKATNSVFLGVGAFGEKSLALVYGFGFNTLGGLS